MKDNQHQNDSVLPEKDFTGAESLRTDEFLPDEEYESVYASSDAADADAQIAATEDDLAQLTDFDPQIPEQDPELTEADANRWELPLAEEEIQADEQAVSAAGLTSLHSVEEGELPIEEEISPESPIPAEETEETVSDTPALPAHRERPARKGRPKRRKGYGLLGIPHLLSAAIWLIIILTIGVTIGRAIWVCAADVLAFGRKEEIVTISITEQDDMDSIAGKLQDAGLIRYPKLFLLYADLSKADQKLTTGTFTLNTLYDYHALVSQMSPRSSTRAVIEDVLIPEGFTCRQIFALLEQKGICSVASLEAWAAEGDLKDYWFLENVERGDKYCLEGYLFPDTYDFYENSTPKQALEKLLDGFEYRFSEELQAQLPVLNDRLAEMMRADGRSEEYILNHYVGLHELLTIASMIEKETAGNAESPKIASVIYNRLFAWGDTPRYLNIDASVIYALGGKTNLTPEDMTVDSPYNTYTNTGLTPGPIASPGLASIKAALEPEDTEFYYYVLDPNSDPAAHHFSKTYEEHMKFIESLED